MKFMLMSAVSLLFSASVFAAEITKDQVTKLVDQTCKDISGGKADDVFKKINASEAPYKDKTNQELYVFVYDKDVKMVAHAEKPSLVGQSYKGKPDVAGVNFRDLIVEGALKNKSGWQDYMYQAPGQTGMKPKTTYYKLCKDYVVCAGMYK